MWRGCSAIALPDRRRSNAPTACSSGRTWSAGSRTAVEAGDSFDAQIVLMALHAKLINAEVVERYGLGAE